MRQLVQDNASGTVRLEEVPTPGCRAGGVLVRTLASVISAGTERAAVGFAQASLASKAKSRPDLVRQVIDKARTDGLLATHRAVRERLDAWMPLGYSSAGVVIEVAPGTDGIAVGDLVACAGGSYATHAEIAWVPRNLVARVPDGVDAGDAAFATLASIALHGIHRAEARPGDTVGVIGLGLIGQLTVQILRAYGCIVVGVDLRESAAEEARRAGALAATNGGAAVLVSEQTRGLGLDKIIVTASAPTSEPMDLAVELAREGATICVVGDVGMELSRRDLYTKELDLVVARSYGHGRHDLRYELGGVDYPVRHIKWTIERNLKEVLRLMAAGQLRPEDLGPVNTPFEAAAAAYALLIAGAAPRATVLRYVTPEQATPRRSVRNESLMPPAPPGQMGVSVLGAGTFARATLLPALRSVPDTQLRTIVALGGLHAADLARRHRFERATSDVADVLTDDQARAVFVATRHDAHARLAADILRAGKHVYVEKPLALSADELALVADARRVSPGILAVGFNRRFAPLLLEMRSFFAEGTSPLLAMYRVNAGALPGDHWVRDGTQGGGRVLGEVCHFVDALGFICGSLPQRVTATPAPEAEREDDHIAATIEFANGSRGQIIYAAAGPRGMPKERIEVLGRGRGAELDNFRRLRLYGPGGSRVHRSWSQDKGHVGAVRAFIEAARTSGASPTPFREVAATTLATLAIVASMRSGGAPIPIQLTEEYGADIV